MTKQKEAAKKKSRTRAFGSAFMLTLCLLILGCGFFVADINTRQMTFGNTEPRLEYAVENGVLRLKAVDGRTVELPRPSGNGLGGSGICCPPAGGRRPA